ncbi:MAG: hypothetical protein LBB76_11340, partial [Azoarcus sp.]|nr:hypothetical protein [Azoarcus sp.]
MPSEGFHGLIDEGSQASESLLDYDSTSATIQRDESGYPTGSAAAYHLVGSEGPAPRAEEVAPATKSVGDGRGRGELSQVNDPLRGKGIKTLKALLDTKISEQLRARIIHKLDTLAQAAAEAKPTPKPKPSPKAQLRERLAKGVPLAA